jgi:hypothetical protein
MEDLMLTEQNLVIVVILVVLNVPIFLWLGRLFFGGWDGFWSAVKFWLTPDFLSMFEGRFWNDWHAEMLLGLYIAVCAGLIFGEYWLVSKVITV